MLKFERGSIKSQSLEKSFWKEYRSVHDRNIMNIYKYSHMHKVISEGTP